MQDGDLVRFKSYAAGRLDDPPYSSDGDWRIGLLVEYKSWEKVATILYRGEEFRVRADSVQKAGKKDF